VNIRSGLGPIHHLVAETRRLLCGHSETFGWPGSVTIAPVSCRACVRMLADDVRRAGPRTDDSED
jgi:hypothetical protein